MAKALAEAQGVGRSRMSGPESRPISGARTNTQIMAIDFAQARMTINPDVIQRTSARCLLPTEDVRMKYLIYAY